jgi:hypothetical protein
MTKYYYKGQLYMFNIVSDSQGGIEKNILVRNSGIWKEDTR